MLFAAIKCRNNRLSCSLRSFQRLIGVYFVCIQRIYYSLLNANELWRTTALVYVDNGQYYTLSRRASDQGSYTKPHATGRRYHLTHVNRWSDCIGYRIEIVCIIGIETVKLSFHKRHEQVIFLKLD